ncbi:MAG: anthranilate phosphoribosyltransferase [bacterium]|nr:anthranilate phosphoribosyltransferase [bacterium]
MIQKAIIKTAEGEDLEEREAFEAMGAIMDGGASPAQIGAFLTALKMKGESVPEITGCARAMKQAALTIGPIDRPVVDTCGTGGDHKGTFNISTVAAFVAAGAGITIAKHGNRSVTSRCGSADLLEGLGIAVDLPPEVVSRAIEEVGIGFLFAPSFHPAMRHAAGPRKELGFRTIFNLLGPLTNPAGAKAQVVGVFAERWVEPLARVLGHLGGERAMVVHGSDGLDEITLYGPTAVSELNEGEVASYSIDPESLGLERADDEEAIAGGDVETNVAIARAVLDGEPGPRRDIVLANAGAAVYLGGGAATLAGGVEAAAEAIDSGAASRILERLQQFSHAATVATQEDKA